MAVLYGTTNSDNINGTGENDTLYGWASGGDATSPSGNDILNGNAGNDTLYGGTGDDSLSGAAGNDKLDGGTGSDTMSGGTGDDTYFVDSTTDKIIESFNQGIDTVTTASNVSAFNYTLGENLENLQAGSSVNNFKGYGNALDNRLVGGYSGNYYLYGGDGNDYIQGGEKGANYLYGEAGNDTIVASQSPFNVNYIDGGAGNDKVTGGWNGAGDTLLGGAGDDEITGLFGNDTLTGGAGADKFIFNANDGVDTITDFSPVDDTILVSADGFGGIPAGFGAGLTPGKAITTDQFTIGAAATDTSDRFIYNRSTGALFFDADGIGSTDQVQIASLSTGLAMNNTDIFVIA